MRVSLKSCTAAERAADAPLRRPLHKQEPRICKPHALYGPCRNTGCTFSHDYSLTEAETAKLRKAAKQVPCYSVMSTEPGSACPWGAAECIYGQ